MFQSTNLASWFPGFDDKALAFGTGKEIENCHKMSQAKKDQLCVVIKIGTSSLVDPATGIKLAAVASLTEAVVSLKRANHTVLLVTSGAVGVGARMLGIPERPKTVREKQALAAVGQVRLMREMNSMLATLGYESAQVLLNIGNFHDSTQCANALQTIKQLFEFNVIPIVNENDVVATPTERFNDNDQLSALVARLISADMLFLLTDVNGLYSANPNTDPDAKRIDFVENLESLRDRVRIEDGPGSKFSTGGMASKLEAVQIAVKGGVRVTVMSNADLNLIPSYVERSRKNFTKLIVPSFGTIFLEEQRNPEETKPETLANIL